MSTERLTGLVKWFNNKAGYGFLKVLGLENEADVFVHFSNIKVEGLEYTYLVQGEYVEFDKSETDNAEHKFQAVNLSGIKGGPLLCQTRFANRPVQRNDYEDRRDDSRSDRRPVVRRGRRSEEDGEDREFTRVVSRKPRTPRA